MAIQHKTTLDQNVVYTYYIIVFAWMYHCAMFFVFYLPCAILLYFSSHLYYFNVYVDICMTVWNKDIELKKNHIFFHVLVFVRLSCKLREYRQSNAWSGPSCGYCESYFVDSWLPCSRIAQLCVPGDAWHVDDHAQRMQNGTNACKSAFIAGRSANEITYCHHIV